jgi:DNA-binding NarL/FixJ family response regulator
MILQKWWWHSLAETLLYGRSEHLTAGEIAIVRAVLSGCTSDKALAEKFVTTWKTQHIHMSRILQKAGAVDRTQLVLMCLGRIDAPRCITDIEW